MNERIKYELIERARAWYPKGYPISKEVTTGPEFGARYAEKLAQKVFDMNPNLNTSECADDVIKSGYLIVVRELGKKSANYKFGQIKDFTSDLVKAYEYLQTQELNFGVE